MFVCPKMTLEVGVLLLSKWVVALIVSQAKNFEVLAVEKVLFAGRNLNGSVVPYCGLNIQI